MLISNEASLLIARTLIVLGAVDHAMDLSMVNSPNETKAISVALGVLRTMSLYFFCSKTQLRQYSFYDSVTFSLGMTPSVMMSLFPLGWLKFSRIPNISAIILLATSWINIGIGVKKVLGPPLRDPILLEDIRNLSLRLSTPLSLIS